MMPRQALRDALGPAGSRHEPRRFEQVLNALGLVVECGVFYERTAPGLFKKKYKDRKIRYVLCDGTSCFERQEEVYFIYYNQK